MFLSNTPWKHQKTFDFVVFSGGIIKIGALARKGWKDARFEKLDYNYLNSKNQSCQTGSHIFNYWRLQLQA